MPTITVATRFCGSPGSANGGYVCGLLARSISGDAEVTLLKPTPLEAPLRTIEAAHGKWELRNEGTVVATGQAANFDLTRLEKASFEEAAAAELLTPIRPHEHLVPTCFVCGPARKKGDGLRIFAGPLSRQSRDDAAVLAATWIPDLSVTAAD